MSCYINDGGCVRLNGVWGRKVYIQYDGTTVSPLQSPWTATATIYDRIGGNVLIATFSVSIDAGAAYFALGLDNTQIQTLGEGTFFCELLVENPTINANRAERFPMAIKFEVEK